MTENELDQLRAEKWHLNGRPLATSTRRIAPSRPSSFVYYPMRPPLLAPTFIAHGRDRTNTCRPAACLCYPRAVEATEVMMRLCAIMTITKPTDPKRTMPSWWRARSFLTSMAGGRTQSRTGAAAQAAFGVSEPACDALELIRRAGPISKQQMREDLGGSISFVALDHALGELWSKLRITRVDYKPEEGAFWDVLYRWAPDAVAKASGCRWGSAVGAAVEVSGLRHRR